MFFFRTGRYLVLLFIFVLSFGEAVGQNASAPDGAARTANGAARDDAPPKIRRAPLDALVVFTTEGTRQTHIRLPGWRIEELDNISNFFLKERQTSTPSFILQEIAATGKVVDNHVEAEVRIVLTTPGSRSVLVPIGMKEGILPFFTVEAGTPRPYRYNGPGTLELMADPQNGQYLALVHPPRAAPDAEQTPAESAASEPIRDLRHELVLTLWFPLTRTGGDENRLAVSFPQAVSSQFLLTVPMAGAVANVAQGFLLDLLESPEQGTTQFKILGLKPDFEVTWRKKKTETVDERPVLSMEEASIIARMEARSTVYDVFFPIRSRAVGFEQVRIQMPPGTTLDLESTERYAAQGGYTFGFLTEEERMALTPPSNEPAEGLARPEPAQILEIRLPRKTVGPVNVRFRAVQQDEHEQSAEWRNLGGFSIREAARQTGQLAVIVPPNLRPNWSPIRGIRRSETGGGVSLDGVDARFDFFSQPFLLRCRLVSPQTKINVKPEYQVRINKGSLALTAKFSYVVYGTKTDRLAINLPGWQWNSEISPTGIVDSVGVEQDENGLLTIPLRTPMDGEFEIELKAFRPVSFPDEEKHRLVVTLPQPSADWIKAAPVVIVSADNVEVVPVDEGFDTDEDAKPPEERSTSRTVNLSRRSRRSLPVTLEIPERQQEPLFYETEPGVQAFVADVQYQRQKITTAMQTEIRLRAPDEHVTQYVSYDVSYVPVERVYFLIPKSLDENGALSARIGGRVVELRDVVPGAGETIPENWSKKMLQLPEAQFRFQVAFDYTIPPVPIEHDLMTPFSLSFIRPYDVPVTEHRVNMMVPTGFRIEPDDEARTEWTPVGSETIHSGTGFRSSQTPDRISLWISTGERDALGTTVVERAWLQTWLYGTIREDRGSYLVTSDRRESVTMWLPPEAVKSRIFVFRDGTPVLPEISPRGELTIPLSEQKGSPMLIEIIYRITPFETSNGRLDMELPHFGPSLVRSEYWQIILPQNRHVIGVPKGWTPEYEWAWTNGLFWGRVPSLTREDVGFEEKSSGVTLIPTESNQYLYSSLHPPSHVSLSILDRSLIVLLSSGLSLVVGLVLIYFPKTRYVGSLFGLAVALLAMMLYRPAPVLLMLQASSLGVLLALGACYVHRILYREEKWVVPKSRAWDDASSPQEVYSVLMEDDSEKNPEEAPDSDEENP